MQKNTFELQVLVNGRPVREAYFQGRAFIEARKGTQYTLKLKNNSHRRAVAVFSVDGIDVLHGKKAEEQSGGYIVDAYSSIEVKGFRVDDNTVSTFKFDDKKNSYANKIGAKSGGLMEKGVENCGVIGARVTLEAESWTISSNSLNNLLISTPYRDGYPQTYPHWTSCVGSVGMSDENLTRGIVGERKASLSFGASCSSYSCSAETSPNLSIGTSWGEKVSDSVTSVSFEKSSDVTDLAIFYGEREELEKFGVEFYPVKKVASWPRPFGSQYCPIP